jgi:hypothetical protein
MKIKGKVGPSVFLGENYVFIKFELKNIFNLRLIQ